jgi:PDZ domain-containing protein
VTATRLWSRSLAVGLLVLGAVFLVLWLVPSGSSLVSEDDYLQGRTPGEQRRISLSQMSASQQVAITVALESLGYEVPEEGARVSAITTGYPADGVIELGDVIVEAKGQSVSSPEELAEAMEGTTPGDEVDITVRRGDEERELQVGTQASENDPNRAVMGVVVEPELDFPVDVEISTRDIGGPSAGLAFALDVVDELGEDLDRGRRVAVTGALNLDGSVSPVGGIKQKTFGAREAGADVFLVPKGENAETAREWADGLEIVPISTFDEALAYLRTS